MAVKGARRNAVRIIGGMWRARLVRFADSEGLRPSGDRIRETLFNWLGQDLTGRRCLDLFAGSGVLGLEAASRGAARVMLIEQSRTVAQALRVAIEMLQADQVELRCCNALEFLAQSPARSGAPYDLVFLDPPFAGDLLVRSIGALGPWLAPNAKVYWESDAPLSLVAGWRELKQGRAGVVHYGLIEPEGNAS
jgi:16S rRNA (guanine966-N2)-methyltransferase